MKKWIFRIVVLIGIFIGGLTATAAYLADKPPEEQKAAISQTIASIHEAHRATIPDKEVSFGSVLLKGLAAFTSIAFFTIVLKTLDGRISNRGKS